MTPGDWCADDGPGTASRFSSSADARANPPECRPVPRVNVARTICRRDSARLALRAGGGREKKRRSRTITSVIAPQSGIFSLSLLFTRASASIYSANAGAQSWQRRLTHRGPGLALLARCFITRPRSRGVQRNDRPGTQGRRTNLFSSSESSQSSLSLSSFPRSTTFFKRGNQLEELRELARPSMNGIDGQENREMIAQLRPCFSCF